MSFVDLMVNDDWSEADIVNRTEAMVRSHVSVQAERILNRKVLGASRGEYTLSGDEQAELAVFQAISLDAQQAGEAARADMALLRAAWGYEAALQTLGDDPSDAQAQAAIDAATVEILELALQRAGC
jgi:hypothetical protein